MKKEFWIKKDPVKDGQDNWKKLSSYEFARFMETADGKSRKENIARIPGGEPGEPIIYMEVDSQTAKDWKRENNRACYLQKTMNALGIEVISYNVSPNVEDWEVNMERPCWRTLIAMWRTMSFAAFSRRICSMQCAICRRLSRK